MSDFKSLNINDSLINALQAEAITVPTEIQEKMTRMRMAMRRTFARQYAACRG